MSNRITQVVRQAAIKATPNARITQLARLAAIKGDAKARVSQVAKLAAIKPIFYLVGDFLSIADKTSSNSFSSTTTRVINTNEIAVITIATDNSSTSNGNTTLHSSLTIGAHSAIKIREYTNASSGADAGVTLSAWYLIAPSTISIGTTVTANLSASKTAKAMSGNVFIKDSILDLVIDGFSEEAATNNNPNSMSVTGSYTGDHVWIRAIGIETDLASITSLRQTDGWSVFKTTATSGSTADTNVVVTGEFAFRSGQASGASDPSFTLTANTDQSNILFGLTVLNNQTYNEYPTGGALAGSQAELQKTINISTLGGARLNGSIDLQSNADFIGSGGILLAGLSINSFMQDLYFSGGVIINGEVDFIDEFYEIGFGGILANGSGVDSLVQNLDFSGGISLSGAAEIATFQETILSGGSLIGGETNPSQVFESIGSGGIFINGQADFIYEYKIMPEGGCTLSGLMDIYAKYYVLANGGCEASGKTPQGIKNTSLKITIIKAEPRFEIGDKVYVRCSKMCCYVMQAVRSIDRNENTFIYDCGLGQFTENVVLSVQEFEELEASDKKDLLCAKRTEEI